VQVPATVGFSGATRLDGAAGASLPLAPATYLTFPVTAADPAAQVSLPAAATFTPACVETPTERLRLVGTARILDAGAVDPPVVARALPASPALASQRATPAAAPGAPWYAWDYGVTVALTGSCAQDALHVDVAYGTPPAPPAPPLLAAAPVPPLFAALASFTTAWPFLAPMLADLTPAVAAAVWEQVCAVANAWGAALSAPAPVTPDGAYVLLLDDLRGGTLHVHAAGTDPAAIRWPLVGGEPYVAPPVADAGGYRADYACPVPDSAAVTFDLVWPGLDVRAEQTAVATCHLVRNGGAGPAFVYRTPPVSFDAPALPLLVVPPQPVTPAGPTLAGTLAAALADLPRIGTLQEDRYLRVDVAYTYPLVPAPEDTPDLDASIPVTAASLVRLETLDALCASVAGECDRWFVTNQPPTDRALLTLAVTVFATVDGTTVPLVSFTSIPLAVPPGWWPAP
jgi:hypothetical protein